MTIKKLKKIINEFDDDDRIVITGKKGEISLDNEILFLEKMIPFDGEGPSKLIIAQTRNEVDIPTELEARIDYYQEENWKEIDTIEDLFDIGFRLDDFKYNTSRYETMKTKLERNKIDTEISKMIDMLAENIIQLYELDIPVINIEETISKMGGKIEENETIYSGNDSYIRTDDSNFSIVIPKKENIPNKNITIAKSLGHLFLHLDFKNSKNKDDDQKPKKYKYYKFSDPLADYQAKQFALSFLMPKDIFKETVRQNLNGTSVDTSEIARYFQVNVDDVSERGHTLEIFK